MLRATSPEKVTTFLTGGLLLFGAMGCANRNWSDWAKVQSLKAETRTEVQLHEDAAIQENRKIKGRLLGVSDDSLTLRLKDGQQRTIRKQDVHRVGIRKPFWRWELLWGTLSITAGYVGGAYLWGDVPTGYSLLGIAGGILGAEAWGQVRMCKIYQAAPNSKSLNGNRQAGTAND